MKEKKKTGLWRHISPKSTIVDTTNYTVSSFKKQNAMSFKYLLGGISNFTAYARRIKKQNDPKAEYSVNVKDFEAVLKSWQINRSELPKIKRGLLLEMTSYLFLTLLLFWGMYTASTLFTYTILAIVILSVGFVTIARYWRYWVLKNERFVFFKDWLTQNYE